MSDKEAKSESPKKEKGHKKRTHEETEEKAAASSEQEQLEESKKRLLQQLEQLEKKSKKDDEEDEREKTEEEQEEKEVPDVHSANAWEQADLGDDQRKAKFLRLMGAAKKEHSGRFVIGENAKTSSVAPEEQSTRTSEDGLETKLESQYKTCMSSHMKQRDRRHRGLGYHEDSQPELAATLAPHDVSEDPQMHFVSSDQTKKVDL